MAFNQPDEFGVWMLPGKPGTTYSGKRKLGYISVEQDKKDRLAESQRLATEAKAKSDYLSSTIGTAVETVKGLPAAAKQLFVEEPAKRGAGVILDITGQKSYQPTGVIETAILGNKSFEGLGSQGAETLRTFGVSEDTAKNFGTIAGVVLMGLDVVGGPEKKGAEEAASAAAKVAKALEEGKTTGEALSTGAKAIKVVDLSAENGAKAASTLSKERGFITSVKEVFPDMKVAGQYIPRSTSNLAIKAANLVKDSIVDAERIAKTGTDDKAVAIASELVKEYGARAQKAVDAVTKDAYYAKAADVATTIASKLTEQGRAVQAASILGKLTPEGQLKFTAQTIAKYNQGVDKAAGGFLGLKKKIPNLTAEQSKTILTEMKAINEMPNSLAKAERFNKLQQYISSLIPSSLYQKMVNIWKAGLLTGVKTSGLNIFSNTFHAASEAVKDYPAAAVDTVASLFTGKRTLVATGKNVIEGTKEGFIKGWRYLKTGFDERQLEMKLDYKKVNFGTSAFARGLQTYEEAVFKIIGSQDQPFYYGAKAKSLASQAIAQSKNAKLAGKEASSLVENLIANPTDEMLKYAVLDAETAVFQNATMLGKVAKAIQRLPGGEVILPFGRTPSAVAMQILNYTPIGAVKTIVQNIGKGKFDQRLFSQGLGRSITGTGLLYTGWELGKKGLVTLQYPTGEREQKLWELEGRQANSVKVGDRWRQAAVLGPAGNVLLIGAHFQSQLSQSGSPTEAMAKATAGAWKSFTEQTFLKGISSLSDAILDPERSAYGYIKSLASSVVPTLVKDVATATDPLERRTESVGQAFKARIPGARNTLEPQINVLGQEKQRQTNIIEAMADPSRPTNVKNDPVVNEFRRLATVGYKVSPTLLGDKTGYDGLTPKENTQLWKRTGDILYGKISALITLPEYQQSDDETKGDTISEYVTQSQLVARAEVVIEKTVDLRGQPLLTKLAELKASGIMTNAVYKKWLELGGENQLTQ